MIEEISKSSHDETDGVNELQDFLNLAPMMMGIAEIENDNIRHIADNNIAANFFGKSALEMRGRLATEMSVPKDYVELWIKNYRLSEQLQEPVRFEYEHTISEVKKWLSVAVRFIGKAASGNSRFSYIVQDVTEIRSELESRAKELVASEEKFSTMFQIAPFTFALVKFPDGVITETNKAWEKLFGYNHEESFGKTSVELDLYPNIHERTRLYEEFARTGSVRNFVTHIQNKYGEIRKVTNNMDLLIIDGEKYILGTIVDITEKSRTEEALRTNQAQIEASFQAMTDGIVLFNPEGKVILVNEAEAEICGYETKEEMIQDLDYFASVFELRDLEGQIIPVKNWPVSRVLRGESIHGIELLGKRLDTKQEWVFSYSGEPVLDSDGNLKLAILITRDITKQKQAETQLLKAKEEAEIANTTKSAFLANMSHEIRTPLGAILGFADLMKDPTLSARERNQFLDTITRNGKALTRIIDDILDLAKVESGKLDIEYVEFSFFDILDEVIDLFRERAKTKGIYLRLHISEEVPARICTDPTRLRQILINIIGNAVKFTQEGGVTINVKAKRSGESSLGISISVSDTGVGISPQEREKLFNPFTQADNTTTRKFGGTGLGLSLSVRLAKALGGDVRIEDCETGGSHGCVFVITFVAKSLLKEEVKTVSTDKQKSILEKQNQALSGLSILVADDSTDNQFLVSRLLSKNGASVETAKNGREALDKALHGHHDIVLMDLQMPEMDGYEATKLLLESGFKKPIIALTAHAMSEERQKTKAAGFAWHLTKPLVPNELIKTVTSLAKGS